MLRFVECAGAGTNQGTITCIFSVMVYGHNGPMAYAVHGILDRHIVMDRAFAQRGCYPAINVLKSQSCTMLRAADPAYLPVIMRAKQVMATYSDMEELIRLGACRPGSSPDVDEAIALPKALEDFIGQFKDESTSVMEGYRRLGKSYRPMKPKTNDIAPQSLCVFAQC